MFHTLSAQTADELWVKAARYFMQGGAAASQVGRGGGNSEVLRVGMTLMQPRQRWIGSRSPAINPAFALAEVVWIVTGRSDSALPNFFNPALPKFQGQGERYHGAYGHRLKSSFGIDQLRRAASTLRKNPNSRQVVLQIWSASEDLPDEGGTPRAPDVPCNISSLLKVRDGSLEWTQIMRSNDLFRGLPHNIIQFTCLQEIMAGWIGVNVGTYNHFSDSLHLYASDGKVSERIVPDRVPENLDSLGIGLNESEFIFGKLSDFCDLLIGNEKGCGEILNSLEKLVLPQAYTNIASILAADALRRYGDHFRALSALSVCTNECLTHLFQKWCARKETQRT